MLDAMALIVLDVRTPAEYAAGHLRGAVNLDTRSPGFHHRLTLLNPRDSYVVYCNGGRRAARARDIMEGLGFTDVASYSIHGAGVATALPVVTE